MFTRPLIVVLDADEPLRLLLEEIFTTESDADVTLADDPAGLVETLLQARPALAVLELRRISDLEQIRLAKADPVAGRIPILALSTWGQGLSAVDARAAGCDACLAKPFDLEELLQAAAALMGRAGRDDRDAARAFAA